MVGLVAQGGRSRRSAEALWTSVKLALASTGVALVLGTCLSFALARYRFFGRSSLSFLVVLPIALPGIVTGVALRNTFLRLGWDLGFRTVVLGHGTFCIVLAFNNVIARLRRMAPNVQEASADLGAHGMQTFRLVTFPLIRSALLAGGLLAFALSFDEIIVTTFTAGAGVETLPQWILNNFAAAQQRPAGDRGGDGGHAVVDPSGVAGPAPHRRAHRSRRRPVGPRIRRLTLSRVSDHGFRAGLPHPDRRRPRLRRRRPARQPLAGATPGHRRRPAPR